MIKDVGGTQTQMLKTSIPTFMWAHGVPSAMLGTVLLGQGKGDEILLMKTFSYFPDEDHEKESEIGTNLL